MLEMVMAKIAVHMRSPGQTESGLVIPDTAKTSYGGYVGDVAAVGPGTLLADGRYIPTKVQPGDVVVLDPRIQGLAPGLRYMGRDYAIVQEHEILAVVERKPVMDIDAPVLAEVALVVAN